ncbi:hypothetical protein GQ55_7G241200 [Panicum hallii var. hallii]|uniref:Uncharacterized protein n=1 Tax=Panicum hallii var. hallii TaxID=1504633 RepID=A0A2T7CYH4_9POAL|nr:hypothetical protein GQ55_7G241200 [Panicum hallii var. hallii]
MAASTAGSAPRKPLTQILQQTRSTQQPARNALAHELPLDPDCTGIATLLGPSSNECLTGRTLRRDAAATRHSATHLLTRTPGTHPHGHGATPCHGTHSMACLFLTRTTTQQEHAEILRSSPATRARAPAAKASAMGMRWDGNGEGAAGPAAGAVGRRTRRGRRACRTRRGGGRPRPSRARARGGREPRSARGAPATRAAATGAASR